MIETKISIPTMLLLSILAVFFAGCSTKIITNADVYKFPSEKIFEIESYVTLSITNFYTEPQKIALSRTVYCDPKQLTDTVIDIIKRELSKKNMIIIPNATRTIRLKVVDPSWEPRLFTQTGQFTLEVELGNGESFSVAGKHITAWNGFRAFNGATHNATVSLLQNPRLAAYLKKP